MQATERKKATITLTEAAKILGMTPIMLGWGIESGQVPFGACIKSKEAKAKRKCYVIPRVQFEKWINGEYFNNEFVESRSKLR